MLKLDDVARTLESMFNGTNSETISITGRPDFQFVVQTTGFHLDHNYDLETKKSFIPVFVTSMGGEYDPVPEVKRASYNIVVRVYFPVRFKDEFFNFNNYLVDCLVGQIRTYGSDKALSNISIPQYNEIVQLDLKNFENWVRETYGEMPIEIMEPYMEMSFNLYLSTVADGYLFGNQVTFTLSFKATETINGVATQVTYSETLKWTSAGTGLSNSPIAQQLIDDSSYKFTRNVVNITNRSQSILVYANDDTFWQKLITLYNSGNVQDSISDLTLTKTYNFATPLVVTYNSIVLGMNENVARGEPLSFTISFGDAL